MLAIRGIMTTMPKQSEHIKKLYRQYLDSARAVVTAQYAAAEKRGEAKREKDADKTSPEIYARKLWKNGWRSDGGKKPYLLGVLQQHTESKTKRP